MRFTSQNNGGGKTPGFTMLELVVAMAIGAVVITMGVMIFQNLSAGAHPSGAYVTITPGTAVMQNFYGLNQATLDVWMAPNYGQRAQADSLRDLLWDDIGKANAVFCLGRGVGVLNTVHPTTIPVPTTFQGQTLDLPSAFQAQLESSVAGATGVFTSYRGACTSRNLTMFILQPAADSTALSVRAVYDVDLIAATATDGTTGTYVSVRRYAQGVLTNFYDVFYPATTGVTVAFNPLAVAFERAARLSVTETTPVNFDRLKVAASRPFYFVWWPDPAMPELESLTAGSFNAADPRAAYPNMGGRTSLFFVIPMFPAL